MMQVEKKMDIKTEAQRLGRMIKYLRFQTGMKREDFANFLHIPLGTVRDWEQGKRKMPEYVYELIEYKVTRELIKESRQAQFGLFIFDFRNGFTPGGIEKFGIKYFTDEMKADVDEIEKHYICNKKRTLGATAT